MAANNKNVSRLLGPRRGLSGLNFLLDPGNAEGMEEVVHYQSSESREEYAVFTRLDESSQPTFADESSSSTDTSRMRRLPSFNRVSSFAGAWPTAAPTSVHGYYGSLEIDLDFTEACKSTSKSRCDYSTILRKLYVVRDQSFPVTVRLGDSSLTALPPDATLRFTLAYSQEQHQHLEVEACGLHRPNEHSHHVMRAGSNKPTYVDPTKDNLPSLTLPFQPSKTTEYFSFACFSSCKSLKRRPLQLIVTLEIGERVVGRNTVNVRVCAFPPRERKNDEKAWTQSAEKDADAMLAKDEEEDKELFQLQDPKTEVKQEDDASSTSTDTAFGTVVQSMDNQPVYNLRIQGLDNYNLICHILQGLETYKMLDVRPTPAELPAYDVQDLSLPPAKRARLLNDIESHQESNGNGSSLVVRWLRSLGLEEYADLFIKAGWDDLSTVASMTLADVAALGITKPGHVRKLELALRLNTTVLVPMTPATDASTPADETVQVVESVERFQKIRVLRKVNSAI